ncbi:thiol peroxidase [Staphylococcus lugdunensis]|uniref:Thiol peroxidase n=1 Tax=Staphylococcus lugdunensis TaxID=28035 RepID=A0A4Q9W920_STALU|nr:MULTISPECIES: thiol peroxidase [Staphylococcus]AMG60452.1 lipid hydroperoxide peroxidase [Staphylococcus lugdunensis]ARJ11266.1 2-Cys peroxiredoxin [Staphylococcus lugdunensis]AST60281.1 lipid hydroperoxide peroxidase [Staphylococcus lugdunensis]ATG68688.1 lipid hydroperoxide peroxidase [Staphylococcus lugdunensis]ATN13941.1 lipid hydroperoxide peroxidase [Staphylococcus lugdunensis]
MAEVTFNNQPIHLLGSEVQQGDQAPNFTVLANDLSEVTLDTYQGQKKLISVVPSIDTGVCDQQTRKFNEEAAKEDGVVLTISVDLPFAQKRWCAANGLDNVIMLSDHKELSFGKNFGVVIEEMRLLNRAVFVLDKNNKVVYKEIVSENTDFPNFDAALEAYQQI